MESKVFYDQQTVDAAIAKAIHNALTHSDVNPYVIVKMMRQEIETSTVYVSNNYTIIKV